MIIVHSWRKQVAVMLSGSLVLLNAASAFAAPADLSLSDSVAAALKNNPSIQMALDDKDKALSGVDVAKAGGLPTLSLNTSGTHNSSAAGIQTGDSGQPDFNFNTSLRLNVPLYSGGRVDGLTDQAKLNADSANLGVTKTQNQIKLDTTTDYFAVLQSQNLVKVSQEAVDNLSKHLQNVQVQFDAGTVAKSDVLRSQVELANAQQNLTKAQNSYNVAVATLNNVMGVPMDTQYTYKDELSYQKYDASLEDSLASALKNRPEIAQAQNNILAAKAGIKVADSGRLPSVNLSGTEGLSGSSFPGQNNAWSVGLSANWDIFDSGLTKAKTEQAQSTLDQASAQDQQMRDAIALEVRQAYLSMKEAEQRIQTAQVAVNQAVEDLTIAQEKYNAGVGTNIDVMDAQLALTQAKTNDTQALYDYNVNKAKLEKAVGSN